MPADLKIPLSTVDFASCDFAEGRTDVAPSCSTKLDIAGSAARWRAEGKPGALDTGRYVMKFRAWGKGPPLVIIPGLCDDAASFVLPMARLSEQFCVIAYDLPTGNGDGARLRSHGPDALVEDLLALLDHLQLSRTHLLGSSFGSTIALRFAARHPERCSRLMLQGGFAHRPLARPEILLANFARYWRGPIERLPIRKAVLEKNHRTSFAGREAGAWEFFLEASGRPPMAAVAHRCLILHGTDLRGILPRVMQPTLLICGESDPLVGRECERVLMAGLPSVARAEIEGCGHLPQYTHPEVFAEVIGQFLLRELT